MTAISLPLPGNVLYKSPQTLNFDKIATFIGGNGSGKSTILKSIFDEKLKSGSSLYQDYKVVCFSSGQNESYSNNFSEYLNKERSKKSALNLDCFYYDKIWSKLLIFLATSIKSNGLVRTFLKHNNYVVESELEEDKSTKLLFDVKVGPGYIKVVKDALQDEAKGESDVRTNKVYHRTLHNFIGSLINENYNFEEPLDQIEVELSQDILSRVSFETDEHAPFNPKVMFFTQAADNDYFIVKDNLNLTFEKVIDGEDNITLRLEDLSDGEYQLLFLYALVDLFDSESTLFLFDEADSHLHYKNIEKLWDIYNGVQGSIITTTHLLDSITKSGIERLKVIQHGEVQYTNSSFKLLQRLESLSEVEETQYKIVSMYKNVVVMDHLHDWEIFKLLLKRKLSNDDKYSESKIDNQLSDFICLSVSSGFVEGQDKNTFGDNKINWLKSYESFLTRLKTLNKLKAKTKRVFLICDADEYPSKLIGTTTNSFLVKGHTFKPTEPSKKPKNISKKDQKEKEKNPKPLSKIALLSWRRREIKHYLLSYTVLGNECDEINRHYAEVCHLKAGENGDIGIDGKFNDNLAKHPSNSVKKIVDPYVNVDGQGFCIDKAYIYVNRIPPEEISVDIVNMYEYLVGKNESI